MTGTISNSTGPQAETNLSSRDFTETLTQRMALLTGEDRVLIGLYLEDGHSFGQIARLLGANPTTIARRVRRIVRQLADETYPLCLAHKAEFSRLELAIIRDHFVRGRTLGHISHRRGVTYYRVRTTILKARAFVDSTIDPPLQNPPEEKSA